VNITNSTLSDNDGSVQNTGTGSVNIANSSFSFDKGAVKNTGAERRPHAACAVNFTILLAVTVVPPTLALDEIAACVEITTDNGDRIDSSIDIPARACDQGETAGEGTSRCGHDTERPGGLLQIAVTA
jgi:hypothetical protein